MRSTKEKVSNAASAAKEHLEIAKAKAEEKVEKATASTKEGEEIAHERRKAKEAEAKMKLHEAKAQHAAEKLHGKPVVGVHGPVGVGTAAPTTGAAGPTYPLGGHHHPEHHKYA